MKATPVLLIAIISILIISCAKQPVAPQAPTTSIDAASEPADLYSNLGSTDSISVNGEPISKTEIDEQYNRLPAEMQRTPSEVADNMIDERLVLQDADAQGVTISPDDVHAFIENMLNYTNETQDGLDTKLAQVGSSRAEYEDAVRNMLRIDKVLAQQTPITMISVTDDEVVAFIAAHPEIFEGINPENDAEFDAYIREQVRS
ncbi:MAG: SurA N-terminal domain-containing protein, partial [Nanoarchaeota archaeon]